MGFRLVVQEDWVFLNGAVYPIVFQGHVLARDMVEGEGAGQGITHRLTESGCSQETDE